MAQTPTQIKILEIQVRYEDAIKQLGKYRQQIEETKRAQSEYKRQLKDGDITQEEYYQHMAAAEQGIKANQQAVSVLTRQVQNQMKVEREQIGSLTQLRAQLSEATREYDNLSRAEREGAKGKELKDKINGITTELKSAEEGTQRFYRNVGNYKDAETGLGAIQDKAKGLSTALLGLAGITGFGSIIKSAQDAGTAYADQMGIVRSVTNAGTADFSMMSKEVERLGATTRYTAQEAGEAMEFLVRNGLSAANATGTLEGVLHLAQANAIELGEAADIVTGQMNAFHLQVKDVSHINDVLSYACANSATNITQLNEALRNTAPIAYTLNVGIEETTAALATLADNNIKGADSGTILKQTFNGLMTSTKLSQKAFAELGVDIDANTVKTHGLIGTLKMIMEKAPTEQQLSDIFGRRAVAGVMALTNSMDKMEEKLLSIQMNAEGTADRMFKQSFSEFTIASKSLQSAWEGLLIKVWEGTNLELRDKFVAELNKINDDLGTKASEIKERYSEIKLEASRNPLDESLQSEKDALGIQLEAATLAYNSAKSALSERMAVERSENAEMIASFTLGADKIDSKFLPAVEKAQSALDALQEKAKQNPENASIKEQIQAKSEELASAVTSYDTARQQFNGEWLASQVESSGDEDLIARYRTAVEELNSKYIPAIKSAETQLKVAQDEFRKNPQSEQAKADLEAKQQALEDAQNAYNTAQSSFNEEWAQKVGGAPEGLAEMMKGPLEDLTAMLLWVRSNIDDLMTMIIAIIGGISLTKLVSHVKTSAATMKTDMITNAQAATAKVNELAAQEASQRQQVEQLKLRHENAAGAERKLIANQLTVQKAQLAETEKALTKAKTAEITVMEKAAAVSTATGWKGAMQSAGMAVKGFVNTSKVAMKSFALTAILSLAIELVMKLWSAFNSGQGPVGKIGGAVKGFIQNALQKLGQAIVSVINYFIEFYNDSIIVRGAIALLGGVFKAVWTIIKTGVDFIVNDFKLLAGIISGVAIALKGLFTLNFDEAANGVKKIGTSVTDFFKNQVNVAKDAGKEIADGFVESFNNMDKKLNKVEWKPTGNNNSSSGGGGTGFAGGNGESGNGDEDDNEDENKNGGGKNGKGGKNSKADKEAAKREEQLRKQREIELKYADMLSEELYKIQEEGAEKRRQALEVSYDKRLNELRRKLETEKNLNDNARRSINALIEVIEQEKVDALAKLAKEEHKKIVEEEIALAESRLKLIRQNTGDILARELENWKARKDAAIKNAKDTIDDEAELKIALAQIESAFGGERIRIMEENGTSELATRMEILAQKHELEVQAAQDAIDVEKRKIEDLTRLGKSQSEWEAMTAEERVAYTEQALANMSEAERASYERQLQEAQTALARKNEAMVISEQQYEQDQTTLREESYAKAVELQKQHLQTEIAEMENAETQRLLELKNDSDLESEEYERRRQRKLYSIAGFEAEKLEFERSAAEASYKALVDRGQLSTQTEEEYNAELVKSKEQWLAKEKAINDAYVKQEEAKYQAMKSLTSSLTGLLDALGEDNKELAMASKIIALAQIAIDTGRAIASGVASASAVPFPGNLAAIATTVATVIANVTSAITTVKSAKFAQGGKVTGPGSGTSDSVPAMLSNGEFVMTAAATRLFEPLLGAMNSIGSGVPMQISTQSSRDVMMTDSLTESFSTAAQKIQPVVSVVEINEFQKRVNIIENLDTY